MWRWLRQVHKSPAKSNYIYNSGDSWIAPTGFKLKFEQTDKPKINRRFIWMHYLIHDKIIYALDNFSQMV